MAKNETSTAPTAFRFLFYLQSRPFSRYSRFILSVPTRSEQVCKTCRLSGIVLYLTLLAQDFSPLSAKSEMRHIFSNRSNFKFKQSNFLNLFLVFHCNMQPYLCYLGDLDCVTCFSKKLASEKLKNSVIVVP